MKIALNRGWDFYFDKNKQNKEVVDIPHTVKVTPFDAFDENIYQTICKYVKRIPLTEEMKDKALILHFSGVAHSAEVYVNGKLKGVHQCGYTAFDIDITKAAFENMQKPGNDTTVAKDKDSTADKKEESAEEEKKEKTEKPEEKEEKIIGEALIEVVVDTHEYLNQPPFGGLIDYMTYGGIYREVHLEVRNKLYIKDVYFCYNQMDIYGGMLHTKLMLSSEPKEKVFFNIKVADANGLVVSEGQGQIGVPKVSSARPKFSIDDIPGMGSSSGADSSLEGGIAALSLSGFDERGLGVGAAKKVELGDNLITDLEALSHNSDLRLSDVILWRPENPFLYNVTVELLTEDGKIISVAKADQDGKQDVNADKKDEKETVKVTSSDALKVVDSVTTRVGLRYVEWRENGFYLNGKKYKLRGLNRHQSFPYVGYAMPDRLQKEDAAIIRKELGLNCVRTSHYPQAQSFYEACDELGLMVLSEVPGWQHIGDDEWKRVALFNVKEMVSQYRNHPSVILWEVRINESADDDELYTKSHEAAKELAPLDFTSGVRNFPKSRLIEDVYSFNDFTYDGSSVGAALKKDITYDDKKGYIVTEHNGHMFPTKSFDPETKRIEHALRHAAVVNSVAAQEDVAGCLGWCMFDYNTHKEFGSGDRICYHGVLDMFRNPKVAADFYYSQTATEPYLAVENGMDLGEYPEGKQEKICIFTNLDSVKYYINDIYVGEYFPDTENYGNLAHPPIIISDFIGDQLMNTEGFQKEKAESIKELLYAIHQYGKDNLPLKNKIGLTKLINLDKVSNDKLTELYHKYIDFWNWKIEKYQFAGYKDGAEVKRVIKTASSVVRLEVKTGSTELKEGDTYDATAVRMVLRDQCGRIMSYTFDSVEMRTEGNIEIIGPSVAVLRGGMGGTYVRSKGVGEGKLILNFRGTEQIIEFTIK